MQQISQLLQITGIFKLNSESTGRHTLVCIYIKSLTVCGVIVPFDWFYYILYSGLSWKFVASCLLILETLETSIFLISNAPPLGKGLHSHPPGRALQENAPQLPRGRGTLGFD